ncbi:MAG: DUF5615 family PIN-like protein [Bacteroidota bacterium]|nr:DUF5615 family PIN-like protein [Bacteroidota bacterium]
MKFLLDVHITYKLRSFLQQQGYEALHVNQILQQSQTSDTATCNYAGANNFFVITKDFDLGDSYHIHKTPQELTKINLGNISNNELIATFSEILPLIKRVAASNNFLIEVNKGEAFLMDRK